MEKESLTIMQNLGYTDELIYTISRKNKKTTGLSQQSIKLLKELGTPDGAIKRIEIIEGKAKRRQKTQAVKSLRNKELIESLIRRCKRSFDAFARKKVRARIVFKKSKPWVIEAPEFDPAIQHLHDVCKKHFDVWAKQGILVVFQFDGSEEWQVITRRKSDQPDNL